MRQSKSFLVLFFKKEPLSSSSMMRNEDIAVLIGRLHAINSAVINQAAGGEFQGSAGDGNCAVVSEVGTDDSGAGAGGFFEQA